MPNLTALRSVLADQAGRGTLFPTCATGMLSELVLRDTVQVHPSTEVNPAVIDHVNLRAFVRRLARRRLDR
jgi:hypothetical protein